MLQLSPLPPQQHPLPLPTHQAPAPPSSSAGWLASQHSKRQPALGQQAGLSPFHAPSSSSSCSICSSGSHRKGAGCRSTGQHAAGWEGGGGGGGGQGRRGRKQSAAAASAGGSDGLGAGSSSRSSSGEGGGLGADAEGVQVSVHRKGVCMHKHAWGPPALLPGHSHTVPVASVWLPAHPSVAEVQACMNTRARTHACMHEGPAPPLATTHCRVQGRRPRMKAPSRLCPGARAPSSRSWRFGCSLT